MAKTKRPDQPSTNGTGSPRVFLYNRVSHIDSVKSGLGLESGADSILMYVKSRMMSGEIKGEVFKGGWQGGKMTKAEDITSEQMYAATTRSIEIDEPRDDGWFIDLAVSAFKKKLIDRPAGARLCMKVRPGDHIVFSKPDRAFRNSADCSQMVQEWKRRGIVAHFSALSIDTSTPIGVMFIQLSGVFAEWESTMRSERVSESLMRAMLRGTYKHGTLGWKKEKGGVFSPDEQQRTIMRKIVELREVHEMSWALISDAVSSIWAEWGHEKATRNSDVTRKSQKDRFWTLDRVRKGYMQAYLLCLVPGPIKEKIRGEIGALLYRKHNPK